MKSISFDASTWETEEDFYLSLLPELGAPDWHGHNLDALWDSITGGDINTVNSPFTIQISDTSTKLKPFMEKVKGLFQDARSEGIDVHFSYQVKEF